jgi:hypothetical protein
VRLLAGALAFVAGITSILVAVMVVTTSSSVRPLALFLFDVISLELLLGIVAYTVLRKARARWSSHPERALAVSALLVCVFQIPALLLLIWSVAI